MPTTTRGTRLAILAFAGQSIAYLLSVILARRLEVNEFEAYVVASAAFILMVTVAPLGVEKYVGRRVGAKVAEDCSASCSGSRLSAARRSTRRARARSRGCTVSARICC